MTFNEKSHGGDESPAAAATETPPGRDAPGFAKREETEEGNKDPIADVILRCGCVLSFK